MQTRVILTTGGTGGHIFPALAVAECLRNKGVEVLFIGSAHGPESRLVHQAGLAFEALYVRGVLGKGWRSASALWSLCKALLHARKLVTRFQPDAVVGFGAYASFPALAVAKGKGIPLALHEQNAFPGLVNRIFAKSAQRIFLSLPDVEHLFPAHHCELTGNPVRGTIVALGRKVASSSKKGTRNLLVMGGSQGARAINSVILAQLEKLVAAGIHIRHQTGPGDWERVAAGYRAYGGTASEVTPFIENMAEAYQWADLVLCRAGATSVAELAVAGKPSVLIPFPYATHDHQTYNAQVMEKQGAALLVQEKELGRRDMGELLLSLLHEPEKLAAMAEKARECAFPDAAEQVAQGVLQLCSSH